MSNFSFLPDNFSDIAESAARAEGSTGRKRVPENELLDLPIPSMQPDEQAAIADALESIQHALSVEVQSEQGVQELKRTAMQVQFTRGLRGEPQKETEIGPVPESWNLRTILDLCDILSGGTPRKSIAEYWSGDIPWASGKDLKTPALDDTIDHITNDGVEAGSRVAPEGAVLLLVRGMGLAKDLPVGVINRPMALTEVAA